MPGAERLGAGDGAGRALRGEGRSNLWRCPAGNRRLAKRAFAPFWTNLS